MWFLKARGFSSNEKRSVIIRWSGGGGNVPKKAASAPSRPPCRAWKTVARKLQKRSSSPLWEVKVCLNGTLDCSALFASSEILTHPSCKHLTDCIFNWCYAFHWFVAQINLPHGDKEAKRTRAGSGCPERLWRIIEDSRGRRHCCEL